MPAGVELKADAYYEGSRPDLRSRIPSDARIVLDVGCGRGALGAERAETEARLNAYQYLVVASAA